MNKELLQLFRQAGGTISITEHGTECEILTYTDHFDPEKFAELIVRECIDTAFHKGHPDLEFLLKHFGVEE